MEIRKINDNISVAGQISSADIPAIAKHGIKTIICNRPDFEVSDQPTYDSIQKAALDNDVAIIFLPVLNTGISEENIEEFAALVDRVEKPMLAYCRTGTRCTFLWALSEGTKGVPIDQIVTSATNAGYDISRITERLAQVATR